MIHALVPVVASIVIAGTPVPIDAGVAVGKVVIDIAEHRDPKKVIMDALPAIQFGVSLVNPIAGLAVGAVVILMVNGKPMTQAETNAWMDRQGIGSQR